MSSKIILLLIFLAFFTRFFALNWDSGYFSHPDENNMAVALSQLSDNNLNPHFFAYGQFPLYLGYFSLKLINIPNTFSNSIYILRFYSATFSLIFLYFAYLLCQELNNATVNSQNIFFRNLNALAFTGEKKLFKNLQALLFVLLLIFSPGLIQIAHFGTTESLLSFVFIANLYYLIKIYNKPQFKYFILSAIISGIGLGSKVTAIFFIWPIIFMGIYKKEYLSSLFFILVTSLLLLVTSPFNFIDINEFISSMNYETGVATGTTEVFYTRQFLHTIPFLFQFTHIFPYVVGLPILIFSIFGLIYFIKHTDKKTLMVLVPVIIYFFYFGQLFVKWTRFMSPIFFIFPLFASLFISKLKKSSYQLLVTSFCLLPGIFFMPQYFLPNPKVVTTNWINQNLPENSSILSESGNVIDLKLRPDIKVTNFDFYTLDNNYDNKLELDKLILESNYVLVPSRRVFKNQSCELFPYSQEYYHYLFSNSFTKIFESQGRNENAEETFTVFDFPTLRLYQPNAPQE